MESYRLKNIVILLLIILNLFLALLVLYYRFQGAQARRELFQELQSLFTASAISLSEDLDLEAEPLPALSVQRNLETEAGIAAMLLGEETAAEHQGGGIYAYTGQRGSVHFRSGGNFDYTPAGYTVEDPAAFCQTFCETYGYRSAGSFSGDTGTFTATQYLEDHPIYNATVSFQFEGGTLTALSGAYVSAAGAASTSASLTAVDALVQLLDYRNETGMVCNSVQDIAAVYELQSGPSAALQLVPKWRITADAYQYYVDCATGAVTRA